VTAKGVGGPCELGDGRAPKVIEDKRAHFFLRIEGKLTVGQKKEGKGRFRAEQPIAPTMDDGDLTQGWAET